MTNAYGISINTLSPTFAPLTNDQLILQQWVALQFETALGFYWSAPEIGADLQTYVLRGLTPDRLAAIPADIQAALGQDERLASVQVTAAQSFTALGATQVKLTTTIQPKDPRLAPFVFAAVASEDIANKTTAGLGA